MGFAIYQPWIEGGSLPLYAFSLSTRLFALVYVHAVDTHTPATYPGCPCKHNFYSIFYSINKHAPAAFPGSLSSFKVTLELAGCQVVLKSYLRSARAARLC